MRSEPVSSTTPNVKVLHYVLSNRRRVSIDYVPSPARVILLITNRHEPGAGVAPILSTVGAYAYLLLLTLRALTRSPKLGLQAKLETGECSSSIH